MLRIQFSNTFVILILLLLIRQLMLKRVKKELTDYSQSPLPYIHIYPEFQSQNGQPLIKGRIIGPKDSQYSLKIFNFEISVPRDYPFKPPKIAITTKIYHPYVSQSGSICCCTIPQLKHEWSPALTFSWLLNVVVDVIRNPQNYEGCGNQEGINQFLKDYPKYAEKARNESQRWGQKW